MKKILVPIDFEEPSNWAMEVGVDIASRANAELVLLHIVEEPIKQSFSTAGEWELSQDWEERLFTLHLIRKAQSELKKLQFELSARSNIVSTELRFGNAFHGISTIIAEHEVDLVVMGTYGHSRFHNFFIGSNTEKVIRHSKSPVLTVHEKPRGHEFRNIVYATSIDQSDVGFSKVLQVAQELYESTIHLVRVNTPSNFLPDRQIKTAMQAFVEKLKLTNYTLNSFSDTSEEEGILHFAEQVNADLIGLATHSQHNFVRVLTGKISDDLNNHSSRPVLTYLTR